jgi:hypothetical protein
MVSGSSEHPHQGEGGQVRASGRHEPVLRRTAAKSRTAAADSCSRQTLASVIQPSWSGGGGLALVFGRMFRRRWLVLRREPRRQEADEHENLDRSQS